MRKLSIRATALALSILLTFGPAASASWAMGTKIHRGTMHLADGVKYTRQYLWSATYSDLRTERYIEYTPNQSVQPAISYGDYVLSKNTLSSLAADLEADGSRVIGGINGDYFVMATGAPLGVVITDGVLRSSSSHHYALGFDAEGNAFIGKPELSITATLNGHTLSIAGGLNKVRNDVGSYVLYTEDYASATSHTSPGIDVILAPNTDNLGQSANIDLDIKEVETPSGDALSTPEGPDDMDDTPITDSSDLDIGDLEDLVSEEPAETEPVEEIRDTLIYTDVPTIGGRLSCTVEQVLQSEGSIRIPEGKLVLSISSQSNEWLVNQLTALQPGDTVDIDITTSDERWETAVTAVGGLYKMVSDGVVESGLDSSQAPRTAVGIRADGSTVFYTVDGRQSGYSVGADMEQVAKRLIELGCVEAVCMDGGGSTTLGATLPGQDHFSVVSSPSEGTQRAVSNALFLVAAQADPGPAEQLVVTPSDAIVFSGAELELSVFGTDRLGRAVTNYDNSQVTYSIPSEGGAVSNGILTVGSQTGTYTLEASVDGLTGTGLITVVPTPDRITIRNASTGAAVSSLAVEPGETVALIVDALYRNLPLVCQNEDFTWAISENLGTIDRLGNYTAGNQAGSGTITVTAGERTVTIPVTVTGYIRSLKDFEGNFLDVAGSLIAQVEPETRAAYVRYGKQSAKLSYDTTGSEFAAVSVFMKLDAADRYLSLWVYGDGSGNTLTAPVHLNDGTSSEITLAVLNFTGWQQITAPLPAGGTQILSLKVVPAGTIPSGIIWLDQVIASNQVLTDHTAPEITLTLSEESLQADLADNMDTVFSENRISVTYDGTELPFTLSGTTVSAQLPENNGLAHRVTVISTDSSGNISRVSADIAATAERELPFSDMDGHWASGSVIYLYDQGIINGVVSDGKVLFLPNDNITRGEFAVMVSRWLGLDLSQYEDVVLPFVDTDAIPSWMLNAVKAMYDFGYMQGSSGIGGLYANATTGITRAEAITLLGRIQPKGYAQTELTFDDTDTIPAWSIDAVATLVAQGAVNGYNNQFSPNNTITRAEMAKILSVLW